jgi:hypothetical protein
MSTLSHEELKRLKKQIKKTTNKRRQAKDEETRRQNQLQDDSNKEYFEPDAELDNCQLRNVFMLMPNDKDTARRNYAEANINMILNRESLSERDELKMINQFDCFMRAFNEKFNEEIENDDYTDLFNNTFVRLNDEGLFVKDASIVVRKVSQLLAQSAPAPAPAPVPAPAQSRGSRGSTRPSAQSAQSAPAPAPAQSRGSTRPSAQSAQSRGSRGSTRPSHNRTGDTVANIFRCVDSMCNVMGGKNRKSKRKSLKKKKMKRKTSKRKYKR